MTINAETNSLEAVVFSIMGGKFRLRLTNPDAEPGKRCAFVLDDNDNVIGHAQDWTYGGSGFAVQTKPFGGYVSEEQIEFV